MLTIAIASENDSFDAEVYSALVSLILGAPADRWKTDRTFNGYRSVWKQIGLYLEVAASAGIRHALAAVDNDGGANGPFEHHESHLADPARFVDEDQCRVCWLSAAIPPKWREAGGRTCVVVPIQSIETWLLCLRGDLLEPSPERYYNRPALKRRFFGSGSQPPIEKRKALALSLIEKPEALMLLRERPSFRHFESQLAGWIGA